MKTRMYLSMLLCVLAGMSAAGVVPGRLRCELRDNPLGIDTVKPRLSWEMTSEQRGQVQTAWQVLAAASAEALGQDKGDLWDSGKRQGNQAAGIAYDGKAPALGQRCYWKVRVWDRDGKASDWSEAAFWEMGPRSENDWQAKWITDGKPLPASDADFYREDPAPVFRKVFELDGAVKQARLYISGIGYFEAKLNGAKVGDHQLDPGWTMYAKRVPYCTFDVTGMLKAGRNDLSAMVGNGWFNPLPLKMWGSINLRDRLYVGRPRLIARLDVELSDGTKQSIVTDETWQVAEGPIRFNSVYLGEIYDARREVIADDAWKKAALAKQPVGELVSQHQPPIRIRSTVKPVAITEPEPGAYIFDMGVNFAGNIELRGEFPAGTKLVLRYGELLYPDGKLNPMTSVCGQIKGAADPKADPTIPAPPAVAWQTDTYIARGDGIERWMPRFTFRGFRYVEVQGLTKPAAKDLITGFAMASDVGEAGEFLCSNEYLNRMEAMCRRTFLSNLFSVQSDCPHRERFAYGGDIIATCEALMMNFDMAAFYEKTLTDFVDSATPDGRFLDTAPSTGIDYCGLAWAMAHPYLVETLYRYYGDRSVVEQHYAAAAHWLEGVAKANPGHIIEAGLHDHEGLEEATPAVMVTPLYYDSARRQARLARLLGKSEEAKRWDTLAEAIAAAYRKQFVDAASGKVGPGTQASQAFALHTGVAAETERAAILAMLLDKIKNYKGGHFSTGILGTRFALETLSREGLADLVLQTVDRPGVPGWRYMLDNNATTLWEHWEGSDNTFSHNHPMFGSVSQWFHQWLGGIQPATDAVGFDRIVIRPQVIGDLNWVKCGHHSIRGLIRSDWQIVDGILELDVTIPANSRAEVYVPASSADAVKEGGRPAAQADGVKFLRMEGSAAVFAVGSGQYRFSVTKAAASAPAKPAMSGNPIFPGWYADPEGIIYGKTYWIFPTYSDAYEKQIFFDCFSSNDLVTWTKHERILDNTRVTWAKRAMWAPGVIEKDGKYYLFFSANDVHQGEVGGIGVSVADQPQGPYRDLLGKPLIQDIVNGAQPIDQFIFKDDDGTYYMYYGGWQHCNVVKLKDNFSGLVPFEDGTLYKEVTPERYVEGPFMFKKDGKYYFMWSEGGWGGPDYSVAYAIADGPLGPFKRIGKILQQNPQVGKGAGHHSVIHVPGTDKWYIVYHRRPLSETHPNHRATCIDKMEFDNNGLIKPVIITFEGVEAQLIP